MNKNWIKSKTAWTAISAIIAAIGGVVTGELTTAAGIQLGITALLALFIRDAIATK